MTDESLGAGTLQESVCIAHMEHPILACKVGPVGEAVVMKKSILLATVFQILRIYRGMTT